MAELAIEGEQIVLHLTRLESLESLHGDLRAPRDAVRAIEVLEDAHDAVDHGFKVGERLPGISEVATIHVDGERLFAVVHHDTPRAVRISFGEGAAFDAWIVGCANPEALVSRLEANR